MRIIVSGGPLPQDLVFFDADTGEQISDIISVRWMVTYDAAMCEITRYASIVFDNTVMENEV